MVWRGLTSRPEIASKLGASANQVVGHLQEMLLYSAHPQLLLRSLAAVARAALQLSYALGIPSLVFLLALLPALYGAAGLYSHRPFTVGEEALLALPAGDGWQLQTAPEVTVEIDGFSHPAQPVTLWRLRASRAGRWRLEVRSSSGASAELSMVVSSTPKQEMCWLNPLDRSLSYPARPHLSTSLRAPWWVALLGLFLLWSWLLTFLPATRKLPSGKAKPKA